MKALVLLFFVCSPIATAQTALQLGIPVERGIGPGQTHEFTVKLEENNFVQFVVEQHGIDVVVKVYTPGGKSLGDYDSPNGTEGPEHVSFIAAVAGNYRITVAPLDLADTTTGSYTIKLVELRPANDQELKTSKNLVAAKAKGIALLTEIEETIPQIKSPLTRIKAELQAAQLLWGTDDKRAAKYMADATTALKELLSSMDPNPAERYSQQYAALVQVRAEIIQAMAAHDPEAALAFLHSTSELMYVDGNKREQFMQESAIELTIADQIGLKDPKRTLEIARRTLKQGYSGNLINTIAQVWRNDPELASEFGNEIAEKLLDEKLLKSLEAANLATNLLRFARQSQMKFQSTDPPRFLADAKYKELLQKVFDDALSFSLTAPAYFPERDAAWGMLNALQSMGQQLDALVPGGLANVEKRIAQFNNTASSYSDPSVQYQSAIANNTADAALEEIAKVPEQYREQLYLQLAGREANNGDTTRARQI